MDVIELVRRWQTGESAREIARQTGLARDTVRKYLAAAQDMGMGRGSGPPTEQQLGDLLRLGQVVGLARPRPAPAQERLQAHQAQIARWLQEEHLQLTRVQELLAPPVITSQPVSYTTLRRFVERAGLHPAAAGTVRLPDTAPGEVAECDFGRLGRLGPPGRHGGPLVWALVIVLCYSRHSFVWPLVRQTFDEVVSGLEAGWRFFDGIPRRLVLDNFPAAIAGPDALDPRPTRLFVEYSQARGFLIDAARPRHPRDKPHVERGMQYVRQRFWKGGQFRDLDDAREQAGHWCRQVAGQRIHGATQRAPLVVFHEEERARLLPAPTEPYDVPIWKTVTVGRDHHVSVAQALYSVPAGRCLSGTALEARADRQLVRLYQQGAVVKVHPRQPKGGRSTDVTDYPPEQASYAARSPEAAVTRAGALGEHIGQFAGRLLSGDFVWSKLRQAQRLLRLAERYTPQRLDAACARALGFDLIDVRRLERILVLALEQEGAPAPPVEDRLRPVPSGRFARPGSAFAHPGQGAPQ